MIAYTGSVREKLLCITTTSQNLATQCNKKQLSHNSLLVKTPGRKSLQGKRQYLTSNNRNEILSQIRDHSKQHSSIPKQKAIAYPTTTTSKYILQLTTTAGYYPITHYHNKPRSQNSLNHNTYLTANFHNNPGSQLTQQAITSPPQPQPSMMSPLTTTTNQ